MAAIQTFLPSQIIKAFEKHGNNAFRVSKNIRKGNKGVRYAAFEVSIDGKWAPLSLKFMNLLTKSKIPPPEEREYGISIQFRGSDVYDRKTKTGVVKEEYGKAKCIIHDAFQYHAKRVISKRIVKGIKNKTIRNVVQKKRDDEKEGLVDLEDPIIRVSIPFGQDKARPRYDIYDATRRNPKAKKGAIPFMLAEVEDENEQGKFHPIHYDNIHTFITSRSACSGVDCMDSIAFSSQGVSLPSKATLLIVKKSKGFKPVPSEHFETSEFEEMAGVDIQTDSEDEKSRKSDGDGDADDVPPAGSDNERSDSGDEDSGSSASGSDSAHSDGEVDDDDIAQGLTAMKKARSQKSR